MARLGVVRQVPTVLFSCLAILLGMAGSASGAYVTLDAGNRVGVCGPNPNVYTYEFDPLALGSPRETTTGPYDFAPGRLPWTSFDPLGLEEDTFVPGMSHQEAIEIGFKGQPKAIRFLVKGFVSALQTAADYMDKNEADGKGRALSTGEMVEVGVKGLATDVAAVVGVKGAAGLIDAATSPDPTSPTGEPQESKPGGDTSKDINKSKPKGAKESEPEVTKKPSKEYIYGPGDDPKINPDGSTNGNTFTTPDKFSNPDEATDKLDPFKPIEGRRPVTIPKGTEVQRGKTPGGEFPGDPTRKGGANETLTPKGLPPGSVGDFEPFEKD